jgi:glutamate/tyrosine decarboxylase-like PLP-dependent enzyme
MVLRCLCGAAERPPLPAAGTGLGAIEIPAEPIAETEILSRLSRLLAGSTNPSSPGWIGHMDPPPTTFSVLGELAAAALNNNMLSYEMSPALTELECRLIASFAERFGLPLQAGGVLVSGGTLANLEALAVARNHAFPALHSGLWQLSARPVILASEAAHSSIHKAAMLLGLGTVGVVPVAVDGNSRMSCENLRWRFEHCSRDGMAPFCVVATAGTTVTGSIDPLPEIQGFAAQHGLWFHVDAAHAGALALSSRYRGLLRGIEMADSITFNPQKWLAVAKTCAMVLFRDHEALESDWRIAAPYTGGSRARNLGELGVQGSRHADALKLWLSLMHLGTSGYSALIEESCTSAAWLADQVVARPLFRLAAPPDTNVVCFRGEPRHLPEAQWDEWNERLQAFLLDTAGIFLSLPLFRGGRWLRAVLINPHARRETLVKLCGGLDAFASAAAEQAGRRSTTP